MTMQQADPTKPGEPAPAPQEPNIPEAPPEIAPPVVPPAAAPETATKFGKRKDRNMASAPVNQQHIENTVGGW